ncbi:hypothetical protein PYW08_012885 [Mythimna loreyi]|uniref:Uncharacterized protein n=1 Tax=Mythimna loreyi TaxID=667449 RepID=A0ACC2Q1J3_9NEOP|nr:hypothetical protein PYW08_012885 [Mythimna loreyi]
MDYYLAAFGNSTTPSPISWGHEDPVEKYHRDYTNTYYIVNDNERMNSKSTSLSSSPFRSKGAIIIRIVGSLIGLLVVLIVIYILTTRKRRTRGGLVLAVRAEAGVQSPPSYGTPSQPDPGLNSNLPPSYQQCTPYSMNEYAGGIPPSKHQPYEDHHHKQASDAFMDNERRACAEHVTPESKTELVFQDGRILERLSLNGSDKTDKMLTVK